MAAKEKCHIYPVILIAWRKYWLVRGVEQAGFKQHGAVFTVWHLQGVRAVLFQKCYNAFLVGIVALHLPAGRRRLAADGEPAPVRRQVGGRRREPQIQTDRRIVGMDIDGGIAFEPFKGPGLR